MQHHEHHAALPGDLPAVAAYGLQVQRAGHTLLDRITFTVPRGVIVGLLGPSGCGKTTLLRSIVGVQKPTGGHIQVLGYPAGAAQLASRVGYVTQAPSVYADLTVLENLRYFSAALGMRGWLREDAVVRVIKEVDLSSYADKMVASLSGGQYSRVSLAVALLNKPELLVMDEPTVGLDPMVRRELWAAFQRLAGEGTTLLISSHVMDEADRCDRLLLMRSGRLLASTGRMELLQHTGCADAEGAFMHLVTAAARAEEHARRRAAQSSPDTIPGLFGQGAGAPLEADFFVDGRQ
ncbi:putative ABC transporter ATP-binding protein YbhF [Streptomyces netropsis]|uniref:ABC-2 type transport system ATP-binding protein n=1 Tax=Streptomyces syringium TaxID=76729 RepID=A0ABS4Y740_9ACTN|nr:ABC transporter ATP-binding protein [Streptomyces syringium]MBP2404596.1 ABC-2 type transport system ATP-binding protein [Streptomyces syringium]SPE57539.1 putative ABC transporter ATP-binding protein YbhF [Streptomyces netropsis]